MCADETYTPSGFTDAANAARCTVRATTGQMLLWPGGAALAPGPDPAVEDDDIVMTFNPPVACVGFDHVSQYADGMSYTHVKVIATDGRVLHDATLDIGSGRWLIEHGARRFERDLEPPPAEDRDKTTDFWGFVYSEANIREVRIDETDDNNVCPDSNIGIDSIRFAPAPAACASGDITGDAMVNSDDARALMAQFGPAEPVTSEGLRWRSADFNRDGVIDEADLVAMLSHAH